MKKYKDYLYLILIMVFYVVAILFIFSFKVSASEWVFPANGGQTFKVVMSYINSGEERLTESVSVISTDEYAFYALCYTGSTNINGCGKLQVYKYSIGQTGYPTFANDTTVIYDYATYENYAYSFWDLTMAEKYDASLLTDFCIFENVDAMKNYCLYGDESGMTYKPIELEDIMPPLENATYDATFELKDFFVERDDKWVSINWSGFKLTDVMLMLDLNSGDNPYSYVFIEFGYSPIGGTVEEGNTDIVWKSYNKFYRAYSGGCEIALSDIAPDTGYFLSRVRVTPYYYTQPPTMPDNVVELSRLPYSPYLRVGNRYTVSWSELGTQSGFVRTDNPTLNLENTENENKTLFDIISNFFSGFWGNLTGIFIPSDTFFEDYGTRMETLVKRKFGLFYDLYSLVIYAFEEISASIIDERPALHFPGIPTFMREGAYIVPPQDVYITDYMDQINGLRGSIYLVGDILMIGAFINFLQDKAKEIFKL